MTLETKYSQLELKAKDDGTFEGYASVFNEKDLGGDIVMPGAFTGSLKRRGVKGVKMLADHDTTKRIGVWDHIEEDSKGLLVKGRLLTEKTIGKEAYIDLKEGALDAMSIGYRTIADKYDGRRKARMLLDLELYEISLVPFPMLESAKVTAVKSALSIEELRELEAILRKKDLSRMDAAKAISGFKEWLRREAGQSSGDLRDGESAELLAALRRNIETIKKG